MIVSSHIARRQEGSTFAGVARLLFVDSDVPSLVVYYQVSQCNSMLSRESSKVLRLCFLDKVPLTRVS